jgi:hypothetical protein
MKAPEPIPAPPMPVMARPTIKAFEVGAAAQTIDPISNIAASVKRTHLVE